MEIDTIFQSNWIEMFGLFLQPNQMVKSKWTNYTLMSRETFDSLKMPNSFESAKNNHLRTNGFVTRRIRFIFGTWFILNKVILYFSDANIQCFLIIPRKNMKLLSVCHDDDFIIDYKFQYSSDWLTVWNEYPKKGERWKKLREKLCDSNIEWQIGDFI